MTKITEIEINKISLNPREVLVAKVKFSNENFRVDNEYLLDGFKKTLEELFPNNMVMVLGVNDEASVEFSIIQQPEASCGPQTCVDCNCGKKESV